MQIEAAVPHDKCLSLEEPHDLVLLAAVLRLRLRLVLLLLWRRRRRRRDWRRLLVGLSVRWLVRLRVGGLRRVTVWLLGRWWRPRVARVGAVALRQLLLRRRVSSIGRVSDRRSRRVAACGGVQVVRPSCRRRVAAAICRRWVILGVHLARHSLYEGGGDELKRSAARGARQRHFRCLQGS